MKNFLRMVLVGLLFVSWSGGADAEEWKRVTFSKGDVTVSFEVPVELEHQSLGSVAVGSKGYMYALGNFESHDGASVIFFEEKEMKPFISSYQLDRISEVEKDKFLTTLNQRMTKDSSIPFRYVTLRNGHLAAFQPSDSFSFRQRERIVVINYPYLICFDIQMSTPEKFERVWDSLEI